MKYCIVANEPCISNLHFGELHSDNFINDKNNLFENYFRKCYKVNIILISFNCFSEYTWIWALTQTADFLACDQQRHRLCASGQSDLHLFIRYLESRITKPASGKISLF